MTTSDNQSPAVPSQLNHHGDSLYHHGDGQPLQNGVNSSSEESSEEEEEQGSSGLESSSEEEEGELNEEAQLENAGVQIDLEALGVPQEGGVAPLHLLSEFVSCCVRDEHSAALILCKKVLEFEPHNQTAMQFLPILQERLKLDDELSTESSSNGSGGEEEGGVSKHCHTHNC